MVAVVTGGGLGVFNSSRDVLGAGGQVGQGRLGVAGERITANAANGNVVVQDRDEHLAGSGPGLELLRTYNAQGGWDGDNADGWWLGWYRRVHSLSGNVNTVGSTVFRTEADGHDSLYRYDGARGLYVSTGGGGQYSTLSYAASSWIWTDLASGIQETYASADGGTTYRLNRISCVRDDNLYDIRYEYDAMGNRRLVDSTYWDGAAVLRDRQTYWYADDAQSRVLVSEGCFSGTNTTDNTKTNAGTVKSPAATRL